MATTIKKIRLINFKRFSNFTIQPKKRINVFVGDNESGKSSILEAIDLVTSASIRRVESIGIDKLLNKNAVNSFLNGEKTFDKLPKLIIELYLDLDEPDEIFNGKNNTDNAVCDGIRLVCEPDLDYISEITDALTNINDYFPYEFYTICFSTFADNREYLRLGKKIRSIMIDSANMSTDYATHNFINRMYLQYTENNVKERIQHLKGYSVSRSDYTKEYLKELNERISGESDYSFGLRKNGIHHLDNDLMIYENNVEIDCKGTGKQTFVKTAMALRRSGDNVDIILIEEPENHLSPVNLRKLINLITSTQNGQLFITTHNNSISTRLELKNIFMLHSNSNDKPSNFVDISDDTAKYFMKAPPASIIEFSLAKRVILVEGPSEFMLMESFYKNLFNKSPEEDDIHIINIRGLSFKRYLEIAVCTKCKVAVITDNDKNFKKNCVDKYDEFKTYNNIQIFYEDDNSKNTFEVVVFGDNSELCTSLFGDNAQEYMLCNKTDAAYKLLEASESIIVPEYIQKALLWIKE